MTVVTRNEDPDATANEVLGDGLGGNLDQPDDGRDEQGRLPLPSTGSEADDATAAQARGQGLQMPQSGPENSPAVEPVPEPAPTKAASTAKLRTKGA